MKDLTGQRLDSRLGSNIREGLQTYVSDPIDDYDRKVIYDDMPEVKGTTFDGYPFLLLDDYSVTTSSQMSDGRTMMGEGSVAFHVLGLRDQGRQAKEDWDSLCDSAHYQMMQGFNDELSNVRIANVVRETNSRFPSRDEKDQNIVVREMKYSFDTQVSYE